MPTQEITEQEWKLFNDYWAELPLTAGVTPWQATRLWALSVFAIKIGFEGRWLHAEELVAFSNVRGVRMKPKHLEDAFGEFSDIDVRGYQASKRKNDMGTYYMFQNNPNYADKADALIKALMEMEDESHGKEQVSKLAAA